MRILKKQLGFVLAVHLLFAVSMSGTASAYSFTAVGTVDTSLGTATINTDIETGQDYTVFSDVLYKFTVADDYGTGGQLDVLKLEFEMDDPDTTGNLEWAFKSSGTYLEGSIDPSDWTVFTGSYGYIEFVFNTTAGSGTPITVGNSLSFIMQDVMVWNDALVPGSGLWREGDAWEQKWSARDSRDFTSLTGGSTSLVAAIPEPASMLLLGSGLIGMIIIKKRKKSKT